MRLAAAERRPGALAAWIEKKRGSRIKRILRFWISKDFTEKSLRDSPISGFKNILQRIFEEHKPVLIKRKTGWLYCEPHIPPPQLLVAGAGHVGRAVAHLGKLLNFEVIVTDDRPEFANSERFPRADKIIVADVSRALKEFPVSPDTYIVIVTRGHRHDQEALRACIKSRAAYVGMIGSGRKVRLIRAEFLRRGWATAEEWDRVHAPIGLAIGSKTVEEIAVSIAAELVHIRSKKQEAG
jgi:xanthine dehydrogenase accessory factor